MNSICCCKWLNHAKFEKAKIWYIWGWKLGLSSTCAKCESNNEKETKK